MYAHLKNIYNFNFYSSKKHKKVTNKICSALTWNVLYKNVRPTLLFRWQCFKNKVKCGRKINHLQFVGRESLNARSTVTVILVIYFKILRNKDKNVLLWFQKQRKKCNYNFQIWQNSIYFQLSISTHVTLSKFPISF